jgi:hypothetical protein
MQTYMLDRGQLVLLVRIARAQRHRKRCND